MKTKYLLITLIVFFLFPTFGDASDYFLKNKDWVAKTNLTKPIKLVINDEEVDLDKNTDQVIQYFYEKAPNYFFLPKFDKISDKHLKYAKQLKQNKYALKPKSPPNYTYEITSTPKAS